MGKETEDRKKYLIPCFVEGRDIIVGHTIIGKIPKVGTDLYDDVVIDNFIEIGIDKGYEIIERRDYRGYGPHILIDF